MKYLLFFLFSIFSIQAQELNKLDEKGAKHGLWKGVHAESKRPRFEGTFEHGKEIGTFKFFDDTQAGTVIATREFNPKDNSCYTIFYNQKGFKVSEGKVINKQFEGEWKYYHFDSPDIMSTEIYVKGKLNGVKKVYYKSKIIAEETTFKNGVKDGLYKNYAENGTVLEESNYKNGEFEGLAVFKSGTGEVVAKGSFKNGKKVGMWDFLEKGKMVKKNMNLQGRKIEKKPIRKE